MFGNKTIAVASLTVAALLSACDSRVSFQRDVNPVLQHNCATCHSPGGVGFKMSGFSVQSYAAVMKGTKYGPIVIPGSSQQSDLVWLLKHGAHPSIDMPKTCEQFEQESGKCAIASPFAKRLPDKQVAMISKWVDQGAQNN